MKKFFKAHPEFLLAGLTIIFIAVIAAAFIFGMRTIIVSVNKSINQGSTGTGSANYDLKSAARLDLKGLVK